MSEFPIDRIQMPGAVVAHRQQEGDLGVEVRKPLEVYEASK